ncbi:rho gtpase-activating protein 68f [Anaeramoeba flamelloides]|uniref:Rho gtpase-activating protein 68f n=1 Tax=Anaeramoeba flamelloides TaxID=1746091 RepID=A0ABQ8Z0V8_9EUKA|nr:rho gtpase-activating protein 68f [Anaeramoeba flamelloides]
MSLKKFLKNRKERKINLNRSSSSPTNFSKPKKKKKNRSKSENRFSEKKVLTIFGSSLKDVTKSYPSQIPGVPLIAVQIVTKIKKDFMGIPGLFRVPGSNQEIKKITKMIDKIGHLGKTKFKDPHVLAAILKLWLRKLPNPLLTYSLYDQWNRARNLETIIDLVHKLPEENRSTLCYLMVFLHKLSQNKKNLMSCEDLAFIFGPNLLRSKENPFQIVASHSIKLMIEKYSEIFESTIVKLRLDEIILPKRIRSSGSTEVNTLYSSHSRRNNYGSQSFYQKGTQKMATSYSRISIDSKIKKNPLILFTLEVVKENIFDIFHNEKFPSNFIRDPKLIKIEIMLDRISITKKQIIRKLKNGESLESLKRISLKSNLKRKSLRSKLKNNFSIEDSLLNNKNFVNNNKNNNTSNIQLIKNSKCVNKNVESKIEKKNEEKEEDFDFDIEFLENEIDGMLNFKLNEIENTTIENENSLEKEKENENRNGKEKENEDDFNIDMMSLENEIDGMLNFKLNETENETKYENGNGNENENENEKEKENENGNENGNENENVNTKENENENENKTEKEKIKEKEKEKENEIILSKEILEEYGLVEKQEVELIIEEQEKEIENNRSIDLFTIISYLNSELEEKYQGKIRPNNVISGNFFERIQQNQSIKQFYCLLFILKVVCIELRWFSLQYEKKKGQKIRNKMNWLEVGKQIQTWHLVKEKISTHAAKNIQKNWRGYKYRKALNKNELKREQKIRNFLKEKGELKEYLKYDNILIPIYQRTFDFTLLGFDHLNHTLNRLAKERKKMDRKDKISSMNFAELYIEKKMIKKELLSFDQEFYKFFEIKPTKRDHELLRPLYDRYHKVRRAIVHQNQDSKNIQKSFLRSEGYSQQDSRYWKLKREKRKLKIELRQYNKCFKKLFGKKVTSSIEKNPIRETYSQFLQISDQMERMKPSHAAGYFLSENTTAIIENQNENIVQNMNHNEKENEIKIKNENENENENKKENENENENKNKNI